MSWLCNGFAGILIELNVVKREAISLRGKSQAIT